MLTRRAAVLGKPIAHSLSPVLHRAGYAAAGLTGWEYTSYECDEAALPGFVARLGADWAGLSLTMPLKEAALAVADHRAPLAVALNAANTLVRTADGWRAENTDAPGMVDALRAAGIVKAEKVNVLGAGGTGRAALAAARDLGATSVTVYARRPEAVDAMRPTAEEVGIDVTHAPWDAAGACGDADLIVSTVPKGIADALRPRWRAGAVLFDVVYDPWPTPLAASAAGGGAAIVSGLDLLLHQAVRQFEMFTGVTGPVEPMGAALAAAAAARTTNQVSR
jgi:shikimate dehydrogenase